MRPATGTARCPLSRRSLAEASRVVNELHAAGVTLARMAERSGVSAQVIWRYRNNPHGWGVDTHVLAVEGLAAFADELVGPPLVGARRRVGALMRMGYTDAYLSGRLGFRALNLSANGRRAGLSWEEYDKVVALYDELSMTPGPSVQARKQAANAGHAPPLAWDDDTIDRPEATPEGVAA